MPKYWLLNTTYLHVSHSQISENLGGLLPNIYSSSIEDG